jgi:Uncharacterised nucleotidyltransferase
MASVELLILVESMRVALLKAPPERLLSLLQNPQIDWKRLRQMCDYHHLRLIVHEALRTLSFENDFSRQLRQYAFRQVTKQLAYRHEASRLLDVLAAQGLVLLPYKGLLFCEKLYPHQTLREFQDFDVLVRPEQAFSAIKILLSEGYSFTQAQIEQDEEILSMLEKGGYREVGLSKTLPSGLVFYLDFHWGINETFHQYPIDYVGIFDQAERGIFLGRTMWLPSEKSLLLMLLNHHAARNCWLKLSYLADWLAFGQQFPDFDNSWANDLAMRKALDLGLALQSWVEEGREVPMKVWPQVLRFWENGRDFFDHFWPKVQYFRLYFALQDQPLSWLAYVRIFVKYHASASPLDRGRLLVLPEKYPFLNALLKLISFVWFTLRRWLRV